MSDKDKYKHYAKNNNDIPIFSRPWWLDAVCGAGNWDVITFEKNNILIAAFIYFEKKKGYLDLNILPKFTPRLGPIFFEKNNTNLTETLNYFEKKLPSFNYFDQTWNLNINNWLPFYWESYSQTTCYSVVIKNIQNSERIINNFKQNRKQDVNKSENYIIKTFFDLKPEIFFQEHKKNLEKKIN